MAQVFLSYAREDAAKAKALAGKVEKAGHEVWWDRHIHGGSEYAGEIQTALNNADVVLVMWSRASVGSEWVRDEAAEGRDSGRLLPVVIDDSKPPLGFRQRQSIDISGWSGKGTPKEFTDLLNAIGEKAPAPAAPEQTGEPARSIGPQRSGIAFRTKAAVAALTAFAVLLLGTWLYLDRAPASAATPTVAVLPFADLSPEGDKAYFAEGVAEAILTMLAREPGLNVVGRTSSWQFKDRSADLPTIRKALGATHVLEGSARTSGDQLRMSVRLLDASNGRQLWAEEYQRRMSNVFAVQDEIGRAVAQRLKGSLAAPLRQSERQVTEVDTYTLYLAARAKMRERKEQSLKEALQLARQVIATDPGYGPGHALYAEVVWLLSSDNYGRIPVEQAVKIAAPRAARAIQLSPNSPEGYAALGVLKITRGLDKARQAVGLLKRAISLDPSRGELRLWLAVALNQLGRHEEALDQYRRVLAMEPLWRVSIGLYPAALLNSGRSAEATAVVDRFESRGGSSADAAAVRANLAALGGDLSGAARYAHQALQLEADTPFAAPLLAWIYHRLGLPDQAREFAAGEPVYSRLLHTGRYDELLRQIRAAGAAAWTQPDMPMAISALARARDWRSLEILYDTRPSPVEDICHDVSLPWIWIDQVMATNLALALRKVSRTREASNLIACIRRRLDAQSKGPVRSPHFSSGSLAFHNAQLLAIGGNHAAALDQLERAIALDWLGQWPDLASYPAFEVLTSRPKFAKLQASLNQRIAKERQELVQQPGRT